MSLTPVSENHPLVNPMEPQKATRFSTSDGEPKLPTDDGDQSYPLRRMFNDLDFKSIENMHKFSREGDAEKLARLVSHHKTRAKKYVNNLDSEKLAPLHYAARYNHLECVKILVEKADAKVNVCNEEKVTPLHFAARYRRKSNKNKNINNENEKENDPEIMAQNKWKTMVEVLQKSASEETKKRLIEEEQKPTKYNSVILYLISQGGNPNAQDVYGCTPLHYAAMRGNEVAASQLLMLDEVNTEVEDNESMTPLHLACAHNNEKIAEMLLKRKANLFNCEESGCIPFHIVCGEGNLNLVNLLVQMAEDYKVLPKMLNAVDHELETPLHYAVENGHVEIVRILLEKGASPNAVTQIGVTPLHMASHCGSVELVKMLVIAGASLDVVDHSEKTPMHEAAKKNHVDVIQHLIEQGADTESRDVDSYTPLLMAASYGHSAAIQLFLDMGCDAFVTEKENKSALYLAVEQNYPDAVRTLLKDENNAELLNIPDLNSNSPLHVACKNGKAEMVQILLDANADDDVKNEEEQTPMHIAAKYGKQEIVKLLHDHSGETLIADEDEDSNTPLHLAAANGHARVVQILLDVGADIDARNCNKWTALDCAAAEGQFRAAQVLLENDSPVDPMDKSKVTPLYLACKNGHDKIVRLLLTKNACISMRVSGDEDDAGCNPLDASIDNGNRECAMAILEQDNWEVAMRNQTSSGPGKIDTPMRKLIRKMPDVAEYVFNKCCVANKHINNKDFNVTYNFEYLEDTYANWGGVYSSSSPTTVSMITSFTQSNSDKEPLDIGNDNGIDNESDAASVSRGVGPGGQVHESYDEMGRLLPNAKKYTENSKKIMKNHPLMIMVRSEREDLLAHPLVTNLLKMKWNNFGQIVYYTNLSIYMFFLIALLAYMLLVTPPYRYYLQLQNNWTSKSTCLEVQRLLPDEYLSIATLFFKYCVIVLSCIQIFKECIQIIAKGKHYFSIENFMEWILYILSFITVFDFSYCQRTTGIREAWQWQTGTVAAFAGIINLVLFIRKVPFFGIFVVMFTDVMWTFMKFLPLFLLFIFAFAFAFYLLLSNQIAFHTLLNSMIRTTVMTIGEFDFDDVFNVQYSSEASPTNVIMYNEVTYAIFVTFIIVMSIITMNLLVGLAVDDIKAVQEKATLQRLAMQVALALDVENLTPDFIRRKYVIKTMTVYPNKRSKWLRKIFSFGNDNSTFLPNTDENLDELGRIEAGQKANTEQLGVLKRKIKVLQTQNASITNMLTQIMQHLKINIEDEEFDVGEDDV